MKAITGVVKGRVQGVGFRYFAQDAAEEAGLSGWVRNLPDRNVEFFAQGDEEDLDRFLQKLLRGPVMARVERVLSDAAEPDPALNDFEIRG
jgi:acylphosphatase